MLPTTPNLPNMNKYYDPVQLAKEYDDAMWMRQLTFGVFTFDKLKGVTVSNCYEIFFEISKLEMGYRLFLGNKAQNSDHRKDLSSFISAIESLKALRVNPEIIALAINDFILPEVEFKIVHPAYRE